ncbi:hypothetical protein VNO80_06056 [Phaseolus coccineus]|uniref:Secreted protein n=1 Tax=Phaseolus coccineus TaxID=3886 RepID=A0AAN9NLE2_PHACN
MLTTLFLFLTHSSPTFHLPTLCSSSFFSSCFCSIKIPSFFLYKFTCAHLTTTPSSVVKSVCYSLHLKLVG